mmetsp:Transcript_6465/g.12911  ORF Transcript_6465/g.12911 Transcript_6465/m.12911 type:complete len:210 (-) Transcript_6465:165-794(-)
MVEVGNLCHETSLKFARAAVLHDPCVKSLVEYVDEDNRAGPGVIVTHQEVSNLVNANHEAVVTLWHRNGEQAEVERTRFFLQLLVLPLAVGVVRKHGRVVHAARRPFIILETPGVVEAPGERTVVRELGKVRQRTGLEQIVVVIVAVVGGGVVAADKQSRKRGTSVKGGRLEFIEERKRCWRHVRRERGNCRVVSYLIVLVGSILFVIV